MNTYVYSVEKNRTNRQSFILKHLATTPAVSFQRIDGMFSNQMRYIFKGNPNNLSVHVQGYFGANVEIISVDQFTKRFSDFASGFVLNKYSLQSSKPLRLVDLWEDDPIGSAGPIVVDTAYISEAQRGEIFALCSPFTDVIQPYDIWPHYQQSDIKKIKQRYRTNSIFSNELRKRKTRSKAIGEKFSEAEKQELVWLDLTLKLRCWALENGFDSFVYENLKELKGEDNYVCLTENQISNIGDGMVFDEHKYMAEMPQAIEAFVSNRISKSSLSEETGVTWADRDPMDFWLAVN